jgi:hypothetical protein
MTLVREAKHWQSESDPGSRSWHWKLWIGRVQLTLHVHRHSGVLPDRWVFQPQLSYDRKHGGEDAD